MAPCNAPQAKRFHPPSPRWPDLKPPVRSDVSSRRVPLAYAAIDGLDYPTIATMLHVPLGTVKTLIFRGKRMLREEITRQLKVPYGH